MGAEAVTSLEDQIRKLGEEIIEESFNNRRKLKAGQVLDYNEESRSDENVRQFKNIITVYNMMKKMYGKGSKEMEAFDSDVLKKIKADPSSIGQIVRDTKKTADGKNI